MASPVLCVSVLEGPTNTEDLLCASARVEPHWASGLREPSVFLGGGRNQRHG